MATDFDHLVEQLQHLQTKLPIFVQRALVETAVEGAQIAKTHMNFTHSSGNGLKGSKTYGEATATGAHLIANTFYATWVEFGNGPPGGRIYPNNAKALRFPLNGVYAYRKWVRTSTPKPFMAPTALQLMQVLSHNIQRAWAQLISEL